jgi:uncharacterized protein YndB with AHSA1/START domain
MPDILLDLPIRAPRAKVFRALSTPAGLDAWWTLASEGEAREGAEWRLDFGPDFQWRARVACCVPDSAFEWEITAADADWTGTRVAFRLRDQDGGTALRFEHRGWPAVNDHYRTSACCWALYLRLLRKFLEAGTVVPYERRLDA